LKDLKKVIVVGNDSPGLTQDHFAGLGLQNNKWVLDLIVKGGTYLIGFQNLNKSLFSK
jgi:glycosyltransferase A (GT-A) superfamily protein (DUF2064 family)